MNKNFSKFMSLYIHIPFCVSKCFYCNFCSIVPQNNIICDYLKALYIEIDKYSNMFCDKIITTIYIGGGTPSVLPNGEIKKLLSYVYRKFNIVDKPSITIEVNPNSFDFAKAKEYADSGINRISIGLQTHDDKLLKLLNRKHSLTDFQNAVNFAQSVNITNISADIIIGIPTQTMKNLELTLDNLLELPIKHISAYGLILEPDTPLYNKIKTGQLLELDEDLATDMYEYTVKRLAKAGFCRYEISNFAIPGYESKHNINYWERGQYLGVGLSSYSFVNGKHWNNTYNIIDYINEPNNSVQDIEIETKDTAKLEVIMLALRTEKGLDIEKFNQTFQTDFIKEYKNVLDELLTKHLIDIKDKRIRILDFNISNFIISKFV